MISLNQISKVLLEGLAANKFINDVRYGSDFNFSADRKLNYPVANIEYLSSSNGDGIVSKTINHSYKIIIGDLFNPDIQNEVDIYSDTLKIAEDFITYLKIINDFDVINSQPVKPFVNDKGDIVAGVVIVLSIEVFRDQDLCSIPFRNGSESSVTYYLNNYISDSDIRADRGFRGYQGSGSGVQGVQGFQGFQGRQGRQGIDGLQGFQGSIGIGVQGIQGNIGVQGNQGIRGIDGVIGVDGLQGFQGYQGSIGTGVQGLQGNIGVQGYQGYQGSIGIGVQGLQGISGVQGNQGIRGIDGIIGVDGLQGFQGRQGSVGTGTQGVQGIMGNTGSNGSNGSNGNQGFQGLQGISGVGTQGIQGIIGNTGSNGNQGFQGYQGYQGIQGLQGLVGDTGSNGVQGYQGSIGTGTQGLQGIIGNTGSNGSNGVQGNQGYQGIQGLQGLVGDTGSNGANGNQGFQGLQGFQGRQGLVGDTGADGADGSQGVQGAIGSFSIISPASNAILLSSSGGTAAIGASGLTYSGSTLQTPALSINGKVLTLGGNFTTAPAFTIGLTAQGNTQLTLPRTGTLFSDESNSVTSFQLWKAISDGSGTAEVIFKNKPTLNNPFVNAQVQCYLTLTAKNSTASVTAAELATGCITSTSASPTTLTLPTATALATQLVASRGYRFEFVIDNSAGASTVTVTPGTNMTTLSIITGSNTLTVSSGSIGVFILYFKNATTCTISRLT